METKPLVAIVGRPNVGKSTLFNRLIGSRRAITMESPGTTRDRIYADAEWQGKVFTCIDTGGLADAGSGTDGSMTRAVNQQVSEAMGEADLVLLVVSLPDGLTPEDRSVAKAVRRAGKDILLVANKADNSELMEKAAEFYALGFEQPLIVSSLHGKGTGDLCEALLAAAKPLKRPASTKTSIPQVAIVGRPNVGKSTLCNRLADSDRMITSDQPHTTRDVTTMEIASAAGPVMILDTAGMPKRKRTRLGIPKFSLLRTLRAINEADVVCLLLDAVEGPTTQDAHIASYVLEAGKGLVLAVNKWDLVEKTADVQEQFFSVLQDKLGWLPSPPVIFLSALTGEKVDRIGRAVYDVFKVAGTRIGTGELNRFVESTVAGNTGGRHAPRLYYLTQVDVRPPTFVCFVSNPDIWTDNHRRWLSNLLRERYELFGTAITLQFRRRSKVSA